MLFRSNEIASLEPERNDIINDRFISIFSICRDRQNLYSNDEYPFIIIGNTIKLKTILSDKQKLYIFLLLCTNLNYFKSFQHELTTDFELLSQYVLASFLPTKAVVKSFGKKSNYTGNAKNKITLLANEIGLKINANRLECISSQNSQERGCDLVAWIPFKDKIQIGRAHV